MQTREVVWGREGNTGWIDLLDGKTLADFKTTGDWKEEYRSLTGSSAEGAAHFIFGEDDWQSFEIATKVSVLEAGNAQILFRMDVDPPGHYLVDFLMGWSALGVSRVDTSPGGGGLRKLSVVNWELREGYEYDLEVDVRDFSITTYIDGRLVNQVTDETYRKGKISLSAYQGKVRYRDIRYRVLG